MTVWPVRKNIGGSERSSIKLLKLCRKKSLATKALNSDVLLESDQVSGTISQDAAVRSSQAKKAFVGSWRNELIILIEYTTNSELNLWSSRSPRQIWEFQPDMLPLS